VHFKRAPRRFEHFNGSKPPDKQQIPVLEQAEAVKRARSTIEAEEQQRQQEEEEERQRQQQQQQHQQEGRQAGHKQGEESSDEEGKAKAECFYKWDLFSIVL